MAFWIANEGDIMEYVGGLHAAARNVEKFGGLFGVAIEASSCPRIVLITGNEWYAPTQLLMWATANCRKVGEVERD